MSEPSPEPSAGDTAGPEVGKPKVIYVMGAGRSGSTVLGVSLGSCEGVFFAGELDKWLPRSGLPKLPDARRRRFWEQVRDKVRGADMFGHAAQRSLERSSALFRIGDWPARGRLRARYQSVSQELYEAVAETAGEDCIVDTSHYPLRARELQRVQGIDLYILFLVRDPRSVVASFNRGDVDERRFGLLTTNAYLFLTHLLSLPVFKRHPPARRLFVRHEDFVADPPAVLRRILAMVGSEAPTPDLTSLSTGIPFHGNRLVQVESIALSAEPEEPARPSRLTTFLQLPFSAVFRHLRPTAAAGPH